MRIKKAVIAAAGLGTRVLPASKAVPKEMLNIVDKPAIQYIVEEVVSSGIEEIMIIISRGKTTIEDHFDKSPELENVLLRKEDSTKYDQILKISDMANIYYIRQKEARGLGDAVLCAKSFVGNEPFAVLYGDDIIKSSNPVCKQLCDTYDEFGLGVVGIKEVTREQIKKYSSMKVDFVRDNLFKITDMIEKPDDDQILSLYSILGRCVLPPEIFSILEYTSLGYGGELQLTDAMKKLAQINGMIGVDFIGKRYDMGNKFGIMCANVEFALEHDEIGEDFKAYLKNLVNNL